MPKVAMLFITTTGIPIADALVQVRLTRTDFDDKTSGILMTRLEEFRTEADGSLLVNLVATKALYHVTAYDTEQNIAIHYDFYVPDSNDPNIVYDLKDLAVEPDAYLSSMPFDETAMLAIIEARNAAKASAVEAKESEMSAKDAADDSVAASMQAIAAKEAAETALSTALVGGSAYDAKGKRINNLAYPGADTDAANVAYVKAYAVAKVAPTENKKVVIFGSSVALGQGSYQPTPGTFQGWAYRLGLRLAAQGYTVVNKSVGGDNTLNLLARFYADVVPENPQTVVISLSLANEGIMAGGTFPPKEAVYDQYLKNIYILVNRCRQLGYKVIVVGNYPNNGYLDWEYSYIKQINEELENTDIPHVNVLGTVDDGTGKWLTGMWDDAYHPNDVGHEAMSRAFSVGLFNRLSDTALPSKYTITGKRGLQMDANVSDGARIMCVPESPIGSFTFMAFVRRPAGVEPGKAIMSVNIADGTYNDPLRINNPSDVWNISGFGNPTNPSTKVSSDGALDHLAMVYEWGIGVAKLFVNGVFSAAFVVGKRDFTYFVVGSRTDSGAFNAAQYEFRDIALYRTALNDSQIMQCYKGWYPKGSLEVFSPCFETELKANFRLVNLAPSDSYFRVYGSTNLISKDVS